MKMLFFAILSGETSYTFKAYPCGPLFHGCFSEKRTFVTCCEQARRTQHVPRPGGRIVFCEHGLSTGLPVRRGQVGIHGRQSLA
jgi:hypothetical protein